MSLEGGNVETMQQLAGLSAQLASDPATRKEFLRLTKKVRPDVQFAELDIEDQREADRKATDDKIEALQKKLEDQQLQSRVKEQRDALRAKGMSDEDITEVEKTMMENGIADHGRAAEFMKFMKQSAEPTTPAAPVDNRPFRGGSIQDFMNDPRGTMTSRAAQIAHDLRTKNNPGQARF
jgi:hypothetical protein